ncbi:MULTISPECIES: DUF1345 domain-containing protein [Halorussus]|uniref:DUF1345 domain-containing protein n=1 Tax=Halorussus TaxID=1070314 RepID=UPI000E212784|nr:MULTISPECIES: DUF1345 domain-containing protein [Halorussus]NHN58464.1 DUF1345 domain-containing protein [Halorussus sp. JP-T4]
MALHTAFALHYAAEYYRTADDGLALPGTDRPGQSDFAYFAFVLGTSRGVRPTFVRNRNHAGVPTHYSPAAVSVSSPENAAWP